ncbi:MAG: hypothetical protein M3423_09695 [Actinomycetota bacterium]|nr:hypothetical protein [Actinomycetota bacterium]
MTAPAAYDEARAGELRSWYAAHHYKCEVFRQKLDVLVRAELDQQSILNARLVSRTKTIDSFVRKAMTISPNTGTYKYDDPRQQIKDLVGLRIVMPLSKDTAPAVRLVQDVFIVLSHERRGEETPELGYSGEHLMVRLREDHPSIAGLREFTDIEIEFQVRAALEDAWASLQHDLIYKTEGAVPVAIQRRINALAGMLRLADSEFVRVRQAQMAATEVASAQEDETSATRRGHDITSAALRSLVEDVVGDTDRVDHTWFLHLSEVVAQLGFARIDDVRSEVSEWGPGVPKVRANLTASRPYTNSVQIFDRLLRLAMGDRYFDGRSGSDAPRDLEGARSAFAADCAALLAVVRTA